MSASSLRKAVRDVEVACAAAKVKLNSTLIEVWLSLVERYVRDVEVASSNLVTSTKKGKRSAVRCSFSFFDCGGFFDVGREAAQVRIHRSEIGKLACQAESV